MAAQEPPGGERRALERAVKFKRIERILRARGLKTTGVAQPRLEKKPIAPHAGRQQPSGQLPQELTQELPQGLEPIRRGAHACAPCRAATKPINRSSSIRAAFRRAFELADGKSCALKGRLKRINHNPADKWPSCALATALI
jgi:hypothetical protein